LSVFLEGKKVRLRSLMKEDLPRLQRLMGDRETREMAGEVYLVTEKGMQEFYDKFQETSNRIWLIIEDRETQKIIGETGFLRIFFPWKTADYSLILWDRSYRGKGYGREAAELMPDYGFNTINLHRVAIGVVVWNEGGIGFWKNIGFREEGRQIDGFLSGGKFADFVMLSLLEDDYREIKKTN